jgi:hypothetical protein
MTEQDAKQSTDGRPTAATPGAAKLATTDRKTPPPLAGFLIAGASLALLFGLAALKGRVRDDDNEEDTQ